MSRKSASEFFYNSTVSKYGCWVWSGYIDALGYGRTGFHGEYYKCHRLAWKLYNGEIPEGLSVLHRCDVRNCINPHHLFLGTQDDNMKDCAQKGRIVATPHHGEDNPMAKFTVEQVRELRRLYKSGVRQYELSNMFKMSRMNVCRIVNNKLWEGV